MLALTANPLFWVSFRLAGGWRRVLTAGGILVGAVLVFSALLLQAPDLKLTFDALAAGWLTFLGWTQAAALTFVGAASVRKQVLRDFTSKMIESHRLTPMTGLAAALGYAIGPNLVLLGFAGVVFLVGAGFSLFTGGVVGYRLDDWVLLNGMLLWLALVLWVATAFFALCTSGTFSVLVLLFIGMMSTGIFVFLPGVGVLVGAFGFAGLGGGPPGMGRSTLRINVSDLTLYSGALQAAVLALCLYGAARKFRGAHLRAFPPLLGLGMVALMAAILGFGIYAVRTEGSSLGAGLQDAPISDGTRLAAALLTAVLLAINPVTTAAHAVQRWRRLQAVDPAAAGPRPITPLLVALLAAALIPTVLLPLVNLAQPAHSGPLCNATDAALLAGTLALTLVPVAIIASIVYRVRDRCVAPIVMWLCLTWLGPLMIEGVRFALGDRREYHPSWVAAVSTPGAVFMLAQEAQDRQPTVRPAKR